MPRMKRPSSQSYTRQEYIHSKPPTRVTRFTLGVSNPDYQYKVTLVPPYSRMITGKSLEAARVTANKVLGIEAGQQVLLKVITYPHEIVRAHRMMGFAGADRLSQGMRNSFGRSIERAAMVKANEPMLAVYTMESGLETAKQALERASKKLPISCRVEVEHLTKEEAA